MTTMTISWLHDLDEALEQARRTSKFVWLDIFNPH